MAKKDVTIVGKDSLRESNTIREITVNGCNVKLHFLLKSDGIAVDTAKKLLMSSAPNVQSISGEST